MSVVFSHLLATGLYLLTVSFLRFKFDFSLVWLWLGGLVGTFLLDLDQVIYIFVSHPEKNDGQATGHHLIFHTATFQLILFALALFILTSGGSLFGSALVMTVNLHLLKDEWQGFLKEKNKLPAWLFWQIEAPMEKYLNVYLLGVSLVFGLLTLFLI